MENNTESINTSRTKKRPTFLTIICILSFVGIGIGILYSAYTYFTIESQTKQAMQVMDMYSDLADDSPFGDLMSNSLSKIKETKNFNLVKIFANLLCLVGVLMMWKLKKNGFFIYSLGEIAIPVWGAVMVGNIYSGTFLAGLGFFATAISFIFPIAFIIMYAVNLKHMT